MIVLDVRKNKRRVSCCDNPTCGKFNPAILKLEDGYCESCGRSCRNCPPSEGTVYQETELNDRVEASNK